MHRTTLMLAAATSLLLAGCGTHTREVVYTPAPVTVAPQPVIIANTAPPAPRREAQPAPPSERAVWIDGYWSWKDGQYEWVPGRWDSPRTGYTWVPHRWELVDGRWQLSGGHWAPR